MTSFVPDVGGIETLAAATLEELEARASLMTRTDRKYVVPVADLPRVVDAIADLDEDVRVLDVDGRRSHRYASTYLDTPGLEAYWRSARRRRHRFKVRNRVYLDSGLGFTEVKTRGPRGSTVKSRTPRGVHGSSSSDPLPEAATRFVRDELAGAGLGRVDVASLVAVLRTSFVRRTLWLPGSGARVTLDVDLAWSLPWSSTATRVLGLAVVETKTWRAGTGIDRALWARGHRPVRISKYGTGLALLMPGLPAHRWHRVLTRHLHPHARREPLQEAS
jgi:hypothetical protein